MIAAVDHIGGMEGLGGTNLDKLVSVIISKNGNLKLSPSPCSHPVKPTIIIPERISILSTSADVAGSWIKLTSTIGASLS